ncbi:MAG: polysaccharide deacetylase family protein [Candidatus Hydrogenedentota bacterium]
MSSMLLAMAFFSISCGQITETVPDKTVVLTFDDSVKSHRTFVGPLLQEYGFQATFFVTHLWMDDTENFMTWQDVGELHEMGFEIGNHSWTHADFSSPRNAARLAGELALVENELAKVDVPKPISFAWCGNGFGPEARDVLQQAGYQFARRGMQPEIPYGEVVPGPLYDPSLHDPLLIPTGGDGYPDWTLEHFKRTVDRAKNGKIVVLQFHGVPDTAHPWVHTPPERFREYMDYLKAENFNVIALKDIAPFRNVDSGSDDPMIHTRYPEKADAELNLPVETIATRKDTDFWLPTMLNEHHYNQEEIRNVLGYNEEQLSGLISDMPDIQATTTTPRLRPYPGGRHPRIGFLDGMIDPQRGTKVSVFTPWNDGGYVVFDVPEAIFSDLGLTFLAHTHIPTIWDDQDVVIENVDWIRKSESALSFERQLPNGIRFGSDIELQQNGVKAVLWLENGTDVPLTNLRTQVCAMLKAVPGFERQSQEDKQYGRSVAVSKAEGKDRYILVGFDHCGRTWGNAACPCIHADPVFPDAAPGERVEVTGYLWFYEGNDIDTEIKQAERRLRPR